MRKLFSSIVLAVALLLCPTPARAGWPVIDPTNIATSILNTANQLAQWSQYITQFKGYYSTFNAIYQGVSNWKDMDWLDMLRLTELPYFDSIQGIDDIRSIAAGTIMSYQELQNIFADIQWFDRMLNDPRFAENQGMKEWGRIMRKASQRQMRRRMVITQAYKTMQRENDALTGQLKKIQSEIESLSRQNPVPTASILALQARISNIQTKIQANKDGVYAQIQIMKEQETAELEQAQNEYQTNLYEMRRNDSSMRSFWDSFLK